MNKGNIFFYIDVFFFMHFQLSNVHKLTLVK